MSQNSQEPVTHYYNRAIPLTESPIPCMERLELVLNEYDKVTSNKNKITCPKCRSFVIPREPPTHYHPDPTPQSEEEKQQINQDLDKLKQEAHMDHFAKALEEFQNSFAHFQEDYFSYSPSDQRMAEAVLGEEFLSLQQEAEKLFFPKYATADFLQKLGETQNDGDGVERR